MNSHEHFLTEFLARPVIENPYPLYTELQEHGPLAYVATHDIWLVSGYRDCLALLKNAHAFELWNGNEFFLSHRRQGLPQETTQQDAQGTAPDENGRAGRNDSAAAGDGGRGNSATPALPVHTPLQILMDHALARRQHAADLEATIRRLADELVTTFCAAGNVECVKQFALPLPFLVLGELFGLEREEWGQFFLESVGGFRPGVQLSQDLIGLRTDRTSRFWFLRYLADALEERVQQPRDDVLTTLALSGYREQGIGQAELVEMIARVCANATLTTVDLIGNAMWLLLQHPDACHQIAMNPALLPNTLHEAHRVESPVQGLFHRATKEVELPTCRIPAGAGLLVLFAAANRDASQFPHPDQFDIERPNARSHLGFGYGARACVGSPLALLIVRIAIETLLTRLPQIRLADDQQITHHPNKLNRGLRALHLQFARPARTIP